jgi:hypothetical protein
MSARLENEFGDALAGCQRFLTDGSGGGVADMRIEGCDEPDRLLCGEARSRSVFAVMPRMQWS